MHGLKACERCCNFDGRAIKCTPTVVKAVTGGKRSEGHPRFRAGGVVPIREVRREDEASVMPVRCVEWHQHLADKVDCVDPLLCAPLAD